jgi:hypothetical protein
MANPLVGAVSMAQKHITRMNKEPTIPLWNLETTMFYVRLPAPADEPIGGAPLDSAAAPGRHLFYVFLCNQDSVNHVSNRPVTVREILSHW